MFDFLSNILNQGLGYIVPVVILLGLLIFVHELGHFIAAKFFGVKVETFSLGFGPKLIKYIRGETTYCVSALPLGGYVKMYGDEPGKDIPEEARNRSYLHKPVGQRIIIALAGPLMNLFFAGVLFYMVAYVGDKTMAATIGEIAQNSEAFQSGFRNYDQIKKVNGQEVETWYDVTAITENSAGRSITFEVLRNQSLTEVAVQPKEADNKDVLSTKGRIGQIQGFTNQIHLSFVGLEPNSPLLALGFKNADHITHINGEEITFFRQIERALENPSSSVTFKIKRYETLVDEKSKFEELEISVQPQDVQGKNLGLYIPETMVAEVKKDSPAFAAGVQVYDRLLKINGNKILSFDDIVKNISSYKKDDPPLQIEFLRGSETVNLSIVPEPTDLEGQLGVKENRYTIGIVPLKNSVPQLFIWKTRDFSKALQRSINDTLKWTKMTCLSFYRMIEGRVPAKNIGGFVSIGQAAYRSWTVGIGAFLKIMAIISINLFIINLLPIPILDGGHLMLFILEAIKGSPLSLRRIEMAQQAGFLFILFLMAFALFNDFSRIFGS